MKKLIIAGCGGFGAEVAWIAEDINAAHTAAPPWQIVGFVDDNPAHKDQDCYGYRVLGSPEEVAGQLGRTETWYYCAIGDNAARERMVARLSAFGWQAATLIHPSVVRAKNVTVGEGTCVAPMSVLSPNTLIGRHVLINQRVTVGHDVILHDFCNICSGAQLNGFCQVGRSSTVGSNASLYPGRSVGDNATVGANSMVIRNVASHISVFGVPARKIA
jgi:sugar O-acyltransferase (sialic acid O-acetyltransferase NeuD family)